MGAIANTIQGRLLAASGCAYGIDLNGNYHPPEPYNTAVGWLTPPTPVAAGNEDIDAALVGINQDGIIVAFRGTLPIAWTVPSILDWWQDIFDVPPVVAGNIPGKVHGGFWAALNAIWGGIEAAYGVLAAAHPTAKLYITGHSKGGGMTTIAAANICFNTTKLQNPAAVYSFAPAHPGNSTFAAQFPLGTIPVTRYENYLDIVPFLPPDSTFITLFSKIPIIGDIFDVALNWDYTPVGTLQYIEQDHAITGDYVGLEVERLGGIFLQMLHGTAGFTTIMDAHAIAYGGGYQQGVAPDIH